LEDFIGSDDIVKSSKIWIENKETPQLFLFGTAGTGKTSLSKLLIKNIPCDSLIVNSSDETGIDSMRNKVQDFAMTMGVQPLKIILLDEFDRVSPEAQCLLRNLMETYSANVRFILTANYKERIIEPITSRCQSFEIKPPSKIDVMKLIVKILTSEKIIFQKEDVAFIVNSYYPDIRKITNFTQQSSVDGTLILTKSSSLDHDYKVKLVELLKSSKSNRDAFKEIRQLVMDAAFSNYDEVYKYLFNKVDDYSGNNAAEVILNLAEAVYQSSLVFEREITFVAAMHKIIETVKK